MKNRFYVLKLMFVLPAILMLAASSVADEGVPEISVFPASFSDPLNIITTFETPGNMPIGLAFDGTHLWSADASLNKIHQLDKDGNEIASFDSPGILPFGITFDQGYLWVSVFETEKVYKLDTSGNVIESFASPPGMLLMGLAFDGTHLWASESGNRKIYKLDTAGNIISSFDSPGPDPTCLAFDGTHIWNTDSKTRRIYKLDTGGNIIASFDAPVYKPYGLVFDGDDMWLSDDTENKILQLNSEVSAIELASSERRTFTISNPGDAELVIGTIAITGKDISEFSLQNDRCSEHRIAPLESATFDIVFAPTSAGEKNALLEIPSNDPNKPGLSLALSGSGEGLGYLADSDLWIRALIHTEEEEKIEAVWKKGGEDETEGGDKVVWGYFHASPDDVNWGSAENPDVFVKIWFDRNGRVDVNFFHVSVPDIEVHSDFPYDGTPDEYGTTTLSRRYIRQYYENGQSDKEEKEEDGNPPQGKVPEWEPSGYALLNDLRIASVINTEGKGPIDALWHEGGSSLTEGGHQVLWGYFHADSADVNWGSENNPDLFVKVWFDAGGRIDVNFFHVSVPDIEVYSDFPNQGDYAQKGTTLLENRYIRQVYER